MLENKLGIMDSAELAREEERLSKKRAKELFEKDFSAIFFMCIVNNIFLSLQLYVLPAAHL